MTFEQKFQLAAAIIGPICVALKVWIILNCPTHPHYRHRPSSEGPTGEP